MRPYIGSRQGSMKSAKNVVAFPKKREERRKDALAFLPAALEIVETPPSPIGRAIAFTIIAVFSIAIAWACLGTVDIVAVAPGKIIPSGRTKTIQPFETGVVRAIHVRDGQSVSSGDVLIELDPTMSGAELGLGHLFRRVTAIEDFASGLITFQQVSRYAKMQIARLRISVRSRNQKDEVANHCVSNSSGCSPGSGLR